MLINTIVHAAQRVRLCQCVGVGPHSVCMLSLFGVASHDTAYACNKDSDPTAACSSSCHLILYVLSLLLCAAPRAHLFAVYSLVVGGD